VLRCRQKETLLGVPRRQSEESALHEGSQRGGRPLR
jgi:hypothetical protein